MEKLPAGYLNKERKWVQASLMDLLVLLYHVHAGAAHPEVGFEDAAETIDTLTRKLDRKLWIEPSALESGLWSCNLMDEQVKWWHPRGLTFDQYVKDLLGPSTTFHKFYNTISEHPRK